jgi:hypothetical protein
VEGRHEQVEREDPDDPRAASVPMSAGHPRTGQPHGTEQHAVDDDEQDGRGAGEHATLVGRRPVVMQPQEGRVESQRKTIFRNASSTSTSASTPSSSESTRVNTGSRKVLMTSAAASALPYTARCWKSRSTLANIGRL